MTDTPAWGTPGPADPAGPRLLAVPEIVLRERQGFFASSANYELFTPDAAPLGAIDKEPGTGGFFSRKELTYLLTDPDGGTIAEVAKPGTWGRDRFEVRLPDGTAVGLLQRENWWTSPSLLVGADGFTARLSGGGWFSGGVRELTEAESERVLGTVSQGYDGLGAFFSGTQTYVVRLSDELAGHARLVSVVAVACIDLLLNEQEKQRRRSAGPF